MRDASHDIVTDKIIVQKVLKGEPLAFSYILQKTGNLVAQIILRMGIPVAERDDLAQDIYTKVFRKLGGFRFESKLSTWVAQIAYNTCKDYLAKRKLTVLPLTELVEEYSKAEQADELINQKQDIEAVRNAIESLPLLYRTLIALYHHEELSYEEISQVTNLPLGTVKNYLYRARKLLKDKL